MYSYPSFDNKFFTSLTYIMLKRYLTQVAINEIKSPFIIPILCQNKAYKCTKFEEISIKYKKINSI